MAPPFVSAMSFFRRKHNSEPLSARLAVPDDLPSLTRLSHTAGRRFLTSGVSDLRGLLAADPTAVAETSGRIVAAASFGWRAQPVAWLRTLLLDSQVRPEDALPALTIPLDDALRNDGTSLVAVTLDEWNEPWLRRPLLDIGYRPMVEVIGYEKVRFDRPGGGNQVITVRRAGLNDLPDVLALDRACFPLPWVKSTEILEPAIRTSPCFIIAEWSGAAIGYAFVTTHHGGRLFHLVRIAVLPSFQDRGIGVRLLAEIVDFCAKQRADVLTLNTQADNYRAQRLYEWFGFARSGDRQTVLGRDIAG